MRSCRSHAGLLFTSPEGDLLRRTNFRRRTWLPAVQAIVGEPMRFHDLRHSHVAQLIAAGEHVTIIQNRLGHASISTTINVYGHLLPGLDDGAADRIETMYRDASVSEVCQIPSGDVIALAR